MNGHRRTGKPMFPKPRQKPANTPRPATPQGRGQCDGGTICGFPHRVKSGLGLPLCMRVYAPQSPPNKKDANRRLFYLVEARRVELLSENQSARLSTSVAVPLTFPLSAAGQQAADFSSSRYNHGPGALPVIVHHSSTPSCGRGPPQSDGCLIKQRTRNQC